MLDAMQYLREAEAREDEHLVVLVSQRHGHEDRRTGQLTREGERQIRRGLRLVLPPMAEVCTALSSQEDRAVQSLFAGLQCFVNGDDSHFVIRMHRDLGYGVWEDLRVTQADLRPTKERLIAAASGEHRNVKAKEWMDAFRDMRVLRRRMRAQVETMLRQTFTGKTWSWKIHVVYQVGHSCSLEIGLPQPAELARIQMLEHGEILISTWTVKGDQVTQIGRTYQVRLPKPARRAPKRKK